MVSMNTLKQSIKIQQLVLLILAAGLGVLAFSYLRPAVSFQDPSAARIVVFHVPMAWLATIFFLVSAVYAGRYLKRRDPADDDAAAAAGEIGLLCSVLATVTGSIFAHSQWGSWWNWDPRETSIFFLLLIYGAYFSLRGSVEDPVRRALFSSVYDVLACPAMIFLIFVMPRILPSLHPERAHLAGSYWIVLLSSFGGFLFFLIRMFRIRCAMGRLVLTSVQEDETFLKPLRPTMVQGRK